jgi:hypothetical protein
MAASIVDILLESARRSLTGDDFYYKRGSWDGSAMFQLPIPPERFEYVMPFAAELTPQQESGIITEEAGIVMADIAISGTTGWKLKKDNTISWAAVGGSFTSLLSEAMGFNPTGEKLSGQMSWWLLANRCFEGYSVLKKDPETAPETYLELHVMKDQLHLQVVPVNVTLRREASRDRVTYRYDLNLKAIGEAAPIEWDLPDEKGIFDSIVDGFNKIRGTIRSVQAAIDDISAAFDSLSRLTNSIVGVITDVKNVFESAQNLIDGAKKFFDFPKNFITQTSAAVESLVEFFQDEDVPPTVAATLFTIMDDLDTLNTVLTNASLYAETWPSKAESYNEGTDRYAKDRAGDQATYRQEQDDFASVASDANGKMTIDQAFGGPILAGDSLRRDNSLPETRLRGSDYTGFAERTVGQGDTIQALAARHLGDARKWLDLAIVNNLKAPWVTNGAKIPNTLRPGMSFMVPVKNTSRPARVIGAGNDPIPGESLAEDALGTDMELAKDGTQWGWEVDHAHGSTDARKVRGIPNMVQAIGSRFRTTRGENIMFPQLGLPRMVGLPAPHDNTAEARLRARQQLLAEPRIDRLNRFKLTVENDALVLDADVIPIGFSTPRVIRRTLT